METGEKSHDERHTKPTGNAQRAKIQIPASVWPPEATGWLPLSNPKCNGDRFRMHLDACVEEVLDVNFEWRLIAETDQGTYARVRIINQGRDVPGYVHSKTDAAFQAHMDTLSRCMEKFRPLP